MTRTLLLLAVAAAATSASADTQCPANWKNPEKIAYLAESEVFQFRALSPSGIAISMSGSADVQRKTAKQVDAIVAKVEKCIKKKIPPCAWQLHIVSESFECGDKQVFPCAGTETEKEHRGPASCGGCWGTWDGGGADGKSVPTVIVPPDLQGLPHLLIDMAIGTNPKLPEHKKCDNILDS